ncbi:MAG: hypothetical protein LBT40_16990 [Deltaproteobacteria bacterium]|jgi:hypothetical protein|nr:hypothetical protein [Deltaproteobacteria bacterium]
MRFPVLMGAGRRADATYFTLGPRPSGGFVLAENLWSNMEESPEALDFFKLMAVRFFPWVLGWQLSWPEEERENLRVRLGLKAPCRMVGDSWTLPLLFAFDCVGRGKPWPDGLFASGAVRQCRGLRCVSMGDALAKLRWAREAATLFLIPKANLTRLRRQGADVAGCVALPSSVERCLGLWRQYA